MLKTIRSFACGVTLVFAASSAVSQGIIFDTTDVKAVFAVGTVISYHTDSLTKSADIGAAGESSWDFSGLVSSAVSSMESVPVASTPYAGDFPQARFAMRDAAFTYSFYYEPLGGTVTLLGTGYRYYGFGGGLVNSGFKGSGQAIYYGNPYPANGYWVNTPGSIDYILPLGLSATWGSNYTESIGGRVNTTLVEVPFGPFNTTHAITCSVDAYGPLALPGGVVRDALRIRKEDAYNDGTNSGVRVGYIFLAKNGATVQVTLTDPSSTSGTVGLSIAQWSLGREDIPVPIELSSFTARRLDGEYVELKWTTLSETDNFGFYVQRRGDGEREFTDLPGGFVAGHGTTVAPQEYGFRDMAAGPGGRWYRLKQVDLDGTVDYSEAVQVRPAGDQDSAPQTHELAQNFPNPCNPATIIRYGLSEKGHVSLAVYNSLGQQVAVLENGEREAGYHDVRFDPTGLASGVYFYTLRAGGFVQTRKLLVVW